MATGMDWALEAVLKYAGFEPEQFKSQLAGMQQIIVNAGGALARIERNQIAIMAALKIPVPEDTPALLKGESNEQHRPDQPGNPIEPASG
jgi:hypothetical protein